MHINLNAVLYRSRSELNFFEGARKLQLVM